MHRQNVMKYIKLSASRLISVSKIITRLGDLALDSYKKLNMVSQQQNVSISKDEEIAG